MNGTRRTHEIRKKCHCLNRKPGEKKPGDVGKRIILKWNIKYNIQGYGVSSYGGLF